MATKTPHKKRLTKKQQGFAIDYLAKGNATLAVKENYNTTNDNSAAAMGSDLLRLPKVREYLESKSERAAEIIYELAEHSENDAVKLNASKDILDRSGFKVPEPMQGENKGNTYNFLFSAETQAEIKTIEERIKARLISQHVQEN